MTDTYYVNSTDVRKSFSYNLDTAVYRKPLFVRRTHSNIVMVGSELFNSILQNVKITVNLSTDEDNTYIATTDEIDDIISTGDSSESAVAQLCRDLYEYAVEYYENYELYSHSSNRSGHLPYIMKILLSTSPEEVRRLLVCRAGEN